MRLTLESADGRLCLLEVFGSARVASDKSPYAVLYLV